MLRILLHFELLLQGEGTYLKMLDVKTIVVVIGGFKVVMVGKAIFVPNQRLPYKLVDLWVLNVTLNEMPNL